jgi:hypothetical protein
MVKIGFLAGVTRAILFRAAGRNGVVVRFDVPTLVRSEADREKPHALAGLWEPPPKKYLGIFEPFAAPSILLLASRKPALNDGERIHPL